jgi:hypothetical protein
VRSCIHQHFQYGFFLSCRFYHFSINNNSYYYFILTNCINSSQYRHTMNYCAP